MAESQLDFALISLVAKVSSVWNNESLEVQNLNMNSNICYLPFYSETV